MNVNFVISHSYSICLFEMMCHLYFSWCKFFNYKYVHIVIRNALHLNKCFLFFIWRWQQFFFSKLTKFVNVCPLIAQKHHLGFFKTYPFRISKIFWTIKCVLWSGTCPLREIKVPWNNIIHLELWIFTEVSCFKPFSEPLTIKEPTSKLKMFIFNWNFICI